METKDTKTEKERGLVIYQVAGQDVKLSYSIVRNFLTKGNGQVTDQDLTQFISICKYNQLNPFLNEAYLIKFGSAPATMVVSKEALFKRAEASPAYKGFQAGIIIEREGEIIDLEGSFYLPGDKLVGGWAKVYRSDRDYPSVARVRMEEYDKGQLNWKEKPSTMIAKVAKVQALREAFPTQLGAMYTEEEQGSIIDITHEDITNENLPEKIETVSEKKEEIKEKRASGATEPQLM
jgi:phage recombination protein Bet